MSDPSLRSATSDNINGINKNGENISNDKIALIVLFIVAPSWFTSISKPSRINRKSLWGLNVIATDQSDVWLPLDELLKKISYRQKAIELAKFNRSTIIMRALRFHGNQDVRLDNVPEPQIRSGSVKIKNGWAGVCGSDLHEYLGGPKNAPTKPHPVTGETIPTIMGHEFSGRITEIADDIPAELGLKVGQKCVVFPVVTDRTCHWCQKQAWGCCANWGFLGYSGIGGGFAEYICVDARDVLPIPDDMRLDVAALVEPLAVAWHAVKLGDAAPNDSVLVLGAGPIGIAVILCLRAQGIENIAVSEISPLRSKQAKAAGAKHVFNPKTDDVAQRAREVSPDGFGPQAVLECAGVQPSFDAAIQSVRGQGTIVNVGIFEKDVTFNPNLINRRSLKYVGSNIYSREEFQEVIDAIADGRLREPERMITSKISLEEGLEKGFMALLHEREKHVKILIGVDDDP